MERIKSKKYVDAQTHMSLTQKKLTRPVRIHLHEYYELEIIRAGTGTVNLNGTQYAIGPGSVYFLSPIDFHGITPITPLEIANLSFEDNLLTAQQRLMFMNRRENYIFHGDHTLTGIFDLMLEEIGRNDPYTQACRQNLLELMLYSIARACHRQNTGVRSTGRVEQSMQYLFCHFRENITLQDVAMQSGYTPNYFSTLFHGVTGEKFVDFLTKLRLNYARTLLLSTDLPVEQVAEKSGFGSVSNFFRSFQKIFGVAPAKYRKQIEK